MTHNIEPLQLRGVADPEAGRPHFESAADYVADVRDALYDRRRPWSPIFAAELKALALSMPDVARQFWPSREICKQLGVPYELLDEPQPYGEMTRFRFLATLQNDAGFRNAVRSILEGGT